MPSRLEIAKGDIIKHFDSLSRPILDKNDIARILAEQRAFWRLATSTTTGDFIKFLVKHKKLREARFNFPSRPVIKYVWGSVPLYQLLLSLKPESYMTHYTAMYFHELTDQAPKTININFEQAAKRRNPGSQLTQEGIDRAFNMRTRLTNNITEYEGYKIRLLNGANTGNLGVVEMSGPEGETLRITDVERTLIDLAVRPEYSGGVFEVLEAYRRASGKVSVNRVAAYLQSIGYIYPYHQVIGFYLTRAGLYKKGQVELLRKFEIKYDFYLAHQIREREYCSEWHLFYPKGLG